MDPRALPAGLPVPIWINKRRPWRIRIPKNRNGTFVRLERLAGAPAVECSVRQSKPQVPQARRMRAPRTDLSGKRAGRSTGSSLMHKRDPAHTAADLGRGYRIFEQIDD